MLDKLIDRVKHDRHVVESTRVEVADAKIRVQTSTAILEEANKFLLSSRKPDLAAVIYDGVSRIIRHE